MKELREGLVLLFLLTPVALASGRTAQNATQPCPVAAESLFPSSASSTTKAETIPWNRWLRDCVPPLVHSRGKRWPLVLWHGPQWQAGVSDADLAAFAERGIVPTVRLTPKDIPKALKLQSLGLPVILLEAGGGTWPYSLGGRHSAWALDLPDNPALPAHWRNQPDPLRLDLWAKGADEIRAVLAAFKGAGVQLDAAWLDFEGQPSVQDYDALMASTEARAKLPAAAIATPQAFFAYRRQLWVQLMSSYVAAPIREFYPAASVTNWITMLSSAQRPVLSWDNWQQPDLSATLFTATNPVAYGIDSAFLTVWSRGQATKVDQVSVDRAYMHLLLRQPSADAANRAVKAPYLHAVPWVARWVRDLAHLQTPMMSRPAYREALRHLWLRGAAAMQVFNPLQPGHTAESLAEVQDAVAVYDEMLAYSALLDHGQVMSYVIPSVDHEGLIWSGLRGEDSAVIRVYAQGATVLSPLRLTVWAGQTVALPVPLGSGVTYQITRGRNGLPPTTVPIP